MAKPTDKYKEAIKRARTLQADKNEWLQTLASTSWDLLALEEKRTIQSRAYKFARDLEALMEEDFREYTNDTRFLTQLIGDIKEEICDGLQEKFNKSFTIPMLASAEIEAETFRLPQSIYQIRRTNFLANPANNSRSLTTEEASYLFYNSNVARTLDFS